MKIVLLLVVLLMPIVSASSDTTPPRIVSFDFEPKVVDASKSNQNITFTMQLKGNLSRFDHASIGIGSSKKYTRIGTHFFWPDDRVSGDNLNGTYVRNITISRYSEGVKLHINGLAIYDHVGNVGGLNETQLEKLGFPTELEVKSWLGSG